MATLETTEMTGPRQAKNLEEACANGDDTYDGFRLLAWLFDATLDDVKRGLFMEVARRKARGDEDDAIG